MAVSESACNAATLSAPSALKLPSGEPLRIEFLDFQGSLERHTNPFIKNLRLLGIDANFRVVDAAQYQSRVQEFDYDVVTLRYGASFTPGELDWPSTWIDRLG